MHTVTVSIMGEACVSFCNPNGCAGSFSDLSFPGEAERSESRFCSMFDSPLTLSGLFSHMEVDQRVSAGLHVYVTHLVR